jgi:hypothetical protein
MIIKMFFGAFFLQTFETYFYFTMIKAVFFYAETTSLHALCKEVRILQLLEALKYGRNMRQYELSVGDFAESTTRIWRRVPLPQLTEYDEIPEIHILVRIPSCTWGRGSRGKMACNTPYI